MESQQGDVVGSGNEKQHECLRTCSHKTGYANVFKDLEAQSHHLQVNNMLKMGGSQNLKLLQWRKKYKIIFPNVGSLLLQITFPANGA